MAKRKNLLNEELTIVFRNMWRQLHPRAKFRCGNITAALCSKEASLTLGQISLMQDKFIHNHIQLPPLACEWLESLQDAIELERDEKELAEQEKLEAIKATKAIELEALRIKKAINKETKSTRKTERQLELMRLMEKRRDQLKDNVHENERIIQIFRLLKSVCNKHGNQGVGIYKEFVNTCVDMQGNLKIKQLESV